MYLCTFTLKGTIFDWTLLRFETKQELYLQYITSGKIFTVITDDTGLIVNRLLDLVVKFLIYKVIITHARDLIV